MQHILTRYKLKAGALQKFKEYLKEFEVRRDECNETLKGEGVEIETFFLDGDIFYVFKKLQDPAKIQEFRKSSTLPIYETVRKMTEDCLDSKEEWTSVLCFEVAVESAGGKKCQR